MSYLLAYTWVFFFIVVIGFEAEEKYLDKNRNWCVSQMVDVVFSKILNLDTLDKWEMYFPNQ